MVESNQHPPKTPVSTGFQFDTSTDGATLTHCPCSVGTVGSVRHLMVQQSGSPVNQTRRS